MRQHSAIFPRLNLRGGGSSDRFAALQPFIGAESAHGDIASLAGTRGESAATLCKTVSRMGRWFRHSMKMELVPTFADGATDDEMRTLLAALGV